MMFKESSAQHTAGYVYLMKSSGGLYKIGCSTDVDQRLGQLRSEHHPYSLALLHSIPCDCMHWGENLLHKYYASMRVHGEWFALKEADARLLCSVKMLKHRELASVSVQFMDASQSTPNHRQVAVQLKTLYGFSLSCDDCGSSAYLDVIQGYDRYQPHRSSLMVRIRCVTCGCDQQRVISMNQPKPCKTLIYACTECELSSDVLEVSRRATRLA